MLWGLAGCQFDRREVPVAKAPPAPEVAKEPPAPPPVPKETLPLPQHKPTAIAAVAEPPPPPTPSQAGPDPKKLVGLGFRETEALLGLPTKQQEKPPAKIWTYSGSNCELNIFFYADINTRQFRALTYEVKETQGTGGTDGQCLAQLMQGT